VNTYKIIARPDIRLAFPGPIEPPLTDYMLVEALVGLTVRELGEDQLGRRTVDVQLQRPTHDQALHEIIGTLQQFGFAFVEATVTEWASQTVERAFLWGLGGGALGATSDNPAAALLAAVVGGLIGAATGAEVHKLTAEYRAVWNYHDRCWVFHEVHQQPSMHSLRPGFSPA
jgi:hypothetical protein